MLKCSEKRLFIEYSVKDSDVEIHSLSSEFYLALFNRVFSVMFD